LPDWFSVVALPEKILHSSEGAVSPHAALSDTLDATRVEESEMPKIKASEAEKRAKR
jgi:hypothetical protein